MMVGRIGRSLLKAIRVLFQIVLVAWATLAIWYSPLPWSWLRLGLAAAFLAFSIWALWVTRRRRMPWAFAGLFMIVALAPAKWAMRGRRRPPVGCGAD